MRLNYSEFVPYAPDTPGVGRVNHVSPHCRGDSKSMKIERKQDGTISAKCFRCGAYGIDTRDVGSVDSLKRSLATDVAPSTGVGDGGGGPAAAGNKGKTLALIDDTARWPIKVYQWVKQYGLTNHEIRDYSIAYDTNSKRVCLPVWWEGKKIGYQLRKIYDEDVGPKYYTNKKGGLGFMSHGSVISNELVIVEDIISAIKVGRVARTVALLSTGLSTSMKTVITNYDKYYIWLDMDNSQVIRQAVKLLKTLELFGTVKLIHTPSDPKTYDTPEIERLLYAT